MSHIQTQIVEYYKEIQIFKATQHDMYIQENKDLDHQWLLMDYRVSKKDIIHIVNDLDEEWRMLEKKKCRRVWNKKKMGHEN
jgi:hypothetical protein